MSTHRVRTYEDSDRSRDRSAGLPVTDPRDAPAGPVLGEDERRQLAHVIDQANTGLPERLGDRAVDALVDAVAPVIAALLSSAEQRGYTKGQRDAGVLSPAEERHAAVVTAMWEMTHASPEDGGYRP